MRFRKLFVPMAAVCALSACATRSYVDESVARVEARVINQGRQIDELSVTSSQALERANDAGVLARGDFLYDIVLSDEGVTFSSDTVELTPDGQQRLTQLVNRLKQENQNVYLEIQGHTDATGPEDYNERLGQQRAEAVRRYLHQQGVALERMATISYGEAMPVAPNDTPDGRATNRRVSIVVMN